MQDFSHQQYEVLFLGVVGRGGEEWHDLQYLTYLPRYESCQEHPTCNNHNWSLLSTCSTLCMPYCLRVHFSFQLKPPEEVLNLHSKTTVWLGGLMSHPLLVKEQSVHFQFGDVFWTSLAHSRTSLNCLTPCLKYCPLDKYSISLMIACGYVDSCDDLMGEITFGKWKPPRMPVWPSRWRLTCLLRDWNPIV